MIVSYKIIENAPYDEGAAVSYWIEKSVLRFYFFGCFSFIRRKIFGNYEMDDTYGKLGQMPFFCKDAAEKRIKQLKNAPLGLN